jgi:predicted nucleic acid-binding protein
MVLVDTDTPLAVCRNADENHINAEIISECSSNVA